VEGASMAATVPMGGNNATLGVHVADAELPVTDGRLEVLYNRVTAGYFELLRIPVRSGRTFTRLDTDATPPVAIVNEAMVRRLWPGAGVSGAVGRRFRFSASGPEVEVVGVVADSRYVLLHEAPRPFVYVPFTQQGASLATLHVRTTGDPRAAMAPVRALLREMEPGLPVLHALTMEAHLRDGLAYFFVRVAAGLAGALGILGLVQTLVGLYGVVGYGVAQRRREIGIRMALGASARTVVGEVLGGGMRMTAVGVAVGLGASAVATRLVQGLLVDVGAWDPVAIVGSVLVLGVCTTLAALVPARRAAAVEPVQVLREEERRCVPRAASCVLLPPVRRSRAAMLLLGCWPR
jgi:predicted permease